MADYYQKIERSGVWFYAGQTPTPVHIVRQNYDYYFEMDEEEGQRKPGEPPRLNADGESYYVLFGDIPKERPWAVHGAGFMTANEAAAWVTAKFGSRCDWK